MAWAMLIDQLGRTLRTIGDAHVVRGETDTARALLAKFSREFELLHDRFEKSSPRELLPDERMADHRNPLSGYEMVNITLRVIEEGFKPRSRLWTLAIVRLYQEQQSASAAKAPNRRPTWGPSRSPSRPVLLSAGFARRTGEAG